MGEYYQLQKARDLRLKWEHLSAEEMIKQIAGLLPGEQEEFERIRNAANARPPPRSLKMPL